MTTEEAVGAWIEGWLRGMKTADPDLINARYADDVVFRSHPFRRPESPAGYAAKILAAGPVDEASFERPLVAGDRAAVEYRVVGGGEEIRGVTLLVFNVRGLVTEHRDYWAAQPLRGNAMPAGGE
jgi:hypothetical protein